jgi:hypothetical protein
MATQQTAAQAGVEDFTRVLLKALSQSPLPATAKDILKALPKPYQPPPKQRDARLEELAARLEELVASGQAHRYAPKGKTPLPRYWAQSVEGFARGLDLADLLGQPRTAADFKKALKARTGFSEAESKQVFDLLLAERRVYVWPKHGKTKERVGLTPPDAQDYLDDLKKPLKTLQTAVNKLVTQLAGAGVAQGQVLDAVRRLLDEELGLPATASTAAVTQAQTPTPPMNEAELERLIVERIKLIEPAAVTGALVSLRDLRGSLADLLPGKEEFDRALLRLARAYRVDLQRHNFPASLGDAERQALVADEFGNFYIGVSLR